ncbi:PDDEXK nuclease domain-containing protein [Chitinophaga polysaccharea]|uniref:PDDEXK nuclease domain-containing protein n=1 Tax=Chitinophaga polysaccharea TaxID=1293035 RepID=UPI0011A3CB90|nr:PDDEXK nuclease domain-containing protein [Chitinophaga polysaccharea]
MGGPQETSSLYNNGRQYRIKTDTKVFYIDLVFYNYILKCFVLIDLKIHELTHQDIGHIHHF